MATVVINHTALFVEALVRIGFNTVTADEIVANGFGSIDILRSLEDKDIDDLVRHIGRWRGQDKPTRTQRGAVITPVPVQISLPFLSINKLKAMRYWVQVRTRQGLSTAADQCTSTEILNMTDRMRFIENITASHDSTRPTKPKPLVSFSFWRF